MIVEYIEIYWDDFAIYHPVIRHGQKSLFSMEVSTWVAIIEQQMVDFCHGQPCVITGG